MEVDELIDVLEGNDGLISVMAALGSDCLTRKQEVKNDRRAEESDKIQKLRELVANESDGIWDTDGARRRGPSAELKKWLSGASMTPALTTITVLEGICAGAARVYLAKTSSVVTVKRGSVLPLPERWLRNIGATTPNPVNAHPNLLGKWCNSVLWDSDWEVELDYTFRDRVDDVCAVRLTGQDKCDPQGGKIIRKAYALPKIATVHPFDGHDIKITIFDHIRMRFFGVRPKFSPEDTHRRAFDALAKAGGHAPIAVLPEFSLHSPDGLDTLIDSSTLPLPELIVAGSAHIDENGVRANTSRVLLDKYPILCVSKYEPFVSNYEDDRGVSFDSTEDIEYPPQVLRIAAGSATRLAIAICSDLNSPDLVMAMTSAGVNVLLSPSWTPRIGLADRALGTLAGYCQCVGVIANAPGHLLASEEEEEKKKKKKKKKKSPLWVCSAVPREGDHPRFHSHNGSPPAAGVLDPNLSPAEDPDYWKWLV